MLPEDAVVLNAFDSGGAGAGYGFFMNHIVLEPQVPDTKADYVVDDGGDILRRAEDVYEIYAGGVGILCSGLGGVQVGVTLEAENFSQRGVDWENAVSVGMKIAADVVAGAPGLVAHADYSDGFGGAKHFVDEVGVVGHG